MDFPGNASIMAMRSTAAVPSKCNEPKQFQQNGLRNHKSSIFPTTSRTSVQQNQTSLQSSIKQTFYATTYNKSFPSNHKSRFSSSAKLSSSYSGRPKPSTSSQPPPVQRRAFSASMSSVNGTTSSYNARGVTGKGSVVDRHADMRLYLQHRQRVLESKPRITSASSFSSQRSNTRRSNSVPISLSRNSPLPMRKGGYAEMERKRQLELGNNKLLKKLVQISNRRTQFGVSLSPNPVRNLRY